LIDKAIQRASQIAKKKNLSLTAKELEQVALTVGLGALKYQDLSQNRQTDIIFDWDKMMSLQGNSAPYLQYTYARFMSILAKSLKAARQYQVSNALGTEEQKLMRKCVQLNEAVCLASQEYMPNLIANYIYELCSLANAYYEKIPVLKCSEPERSMRLGLIKNIALTIKLSLGLLGISVMKKM
jgi:arginyl-tRNA synthetase